MSDEMLAPTTLEEVTKGAFYRSVAERIDEIFDRFNQGQVPPDAIVFEGLPWLRYKNRLWETPSEQTGTERRFVEHSFIQEVEVNPDILAAQHTFIHDILNAAIASEGASILWKITIAAGNVGEPGDAKVKFGVRLVFTWLTAIDG